MITMVPIAYLLTSTVSAAANAGSARPPCSSQTLGWRSCQLHATGELERCRHHQHPVDADAADRCPNAEVDPCQRDGLQSHRQLHPAVSHQRRSTYRGRLSSWPHPGCHSATSHHLVGRRTVPDRYDQRRLSATGPPNRGLHLTANDQRQLGRRRGTRQPVGVQALVAITDTSITPTHDHESLSGLERVCLCAGSDRYRRSGIPPLAHRPAPTSPGTPDPGFCHHQRRHRSHRIRDRERHRDQDRFS